MKRMKSIWILLAVVLFSVVLVMLSAAEDAGHISSVVAVPIMKQSGVLRANETKSYRFSLENNMTIHYHNTEKENTIVKIYDASDRLLYDSGSALAVKSIDVFLESGSYEIAIKNPNFSNEISFGFALERDVVLNPSVFTYEKDTITMTPDAYFTLSVKCSGNQTIHFTSLNQEIVRSWSDDTLRALKVGSADVLAETDTSAMLFHIKVAKVTERIKLMNKISGTLKAGESETLPFVLSEDAVVELDNIPDPYYVDPNYDDRYGGLLLKIYDSNGVVVPYLIKFGTVCVCLQKGQYQIVITNTANWEKKYSDFSVTALLTKQIPTTEISLDKTSISLYLYYRSGKTTETLKVKYLPANSNDELKWSTSNKKVATVKDGIVTAKGYGVAIITAKKGNKEATCTVSVVNPAKSLELNKTRIILDVAGQSVKISADIEPYNTTDKLTWKTSNSEIAELEITSKRTCNVYLKRHGTVVVTAKIGRCTAKCKITVKFDGSFLIDWGQEINIANKTDSFNAVWRSEDSTIASVNRNGKVSGKQGGSTIIIREENGSTYQYLITVKTRAIHLNHKRIHVFVCNQAKFNSEKLKVKNAGDDLTFKSSNTAVAVVNANGKVIAKSPGTATITAYSGGGSDTCKVTVNKLVYGTVKGKVTTLSGYRGGYEPEYAAKIYAYDLFDETRSYRFVQNNEPTYSIKLPVGAYRLEFYSGNCRDEEKVYVRGNQTVSYNARLN